MAIQISGTTVINDNKKGIFRSLNPGTYTTENRPTSPSVGDIIFSTTNSSIQVWNGSTWINTYS